MSFQFSSFQYVYRRGQTHHFERKDNNDKVALNGVDYNDMFGEYFEF